MRRQALEPYIGKSPLPFGNCDDECLHVLCESGPVNLQKPDINGVSKLGAWQGLLVSLVAYILLPFVFVVVDVCLVYF